LTITGAPTGFGPLGIAGQGVDTRSLSYDELADMLRIERESARHLAFRRRWRRTKGNDGKARVEVPLEAIPVPKPATPTGDDPLSITGAAADTPTGSDVVLTRHIERLEGMLIEAQARLTDVEADRDAARDEAREASRMREAVEAQLAALNTVLGIAHERAAEERRQAEERIAAERQRAEDWKLAADRFASQAEKLAERRPWWRRLAG
jgi:hypothetical protein